MCGDLRDTELSMSVKKQIRLFEVPLAFISRCLRSSISGNRQHISTDLGQYVLGGPQDNFQAICRAQAVIEALCLCDYCLDVSWTSLLHFTRIRGLIAAHTKLL